MRVLGYGAYAGPHDLDLPSWCWRDPEDCWNNYVYPQLRAEMSRMVTSAAVNQGGGELKAMLEDEGKVLKQNITMILVVGGLAIVGGTWWARRR